MDTKEREEAARYALQCRKASLEELRAMMERAAGTENTENRKVETRMIDGRDYFYLFSDGDVVPVNFRNDRADKKRLAWGNCFATRAEAEAARERVRAALKGESGGASAESAATQLALQDAEDALARTREERDKLRGEVERLSRANAELAAKNVELQEQIRELEHGRHCALLHSKANSEDAAYWKQTAEAMTKMFMDVESELRELKANNDKEGKEDDGT